MKKYYAPLICFVAINMIGYVYASAKKDEKPNNDLFRPNLNLNQEIRVSDDKGVLLSSMVASLKVKDTIKFYLTDGTELKGIVNEISSEIRAQENVQIYKVYGELLNKENAGFGFVLTSDDVFAGAVVFRNSDETYVVTYSSELKAHILVKRIKAPKIKPSFLKKDQKIPLTNFTCFC